ncbi:hypothetical protein SDC9_181363 [bioreactor metagenome]|uniref:Uncharacterized protein n=1 Tax=bioreactor metagenome TaxID=1076179 RepID=A0A645H4C8_9ZZZZ
MGPASVLGQFPQPALGEVSPHRVHLSPYLVQIVARYGLLPVLLAEGFKGFHGEPPACGTVAVQVLHVAQAVRPVYEHQPVVPGEFRVGCGIEEIASHEHRKSQYHGMSRTEKVHGAVGIQSHLR